MNSEYANVQYMVGENKLLSSIYMIMGNRQHGTVSSIHGMRKKVYLLFLLKVIPSCKMNDLQTIHNQSVVT